MSTSAEYFVNHRRVDRFPWSLYHRALLKPITRVLAEYGPSPRVLIVGCGLEAGMMGAPRGTIFFGCDIDERAIEACRRTFPERAHRFATCPDAYALPSDPGFTEPFDVVVAKEVVEHVLEPARWASVLSTRVRPGGSLVLTTPNYGAYSTLPLLESTVLEWIARRDGYSRRHIHPTKFDRRALADLDVGPDMRLVAVDRTLTGWALVGRWRRAPSTHSR